MSQFEQDIRTSLNTIQTQLAAVQNQADGANASIARIGTTAKVASSGVGDIEKSLGKVTAAATRSGGPIAGMITQLGGLAAFNPLALAAGAAIGGITAGVYSLIAALREANAEQEKLNATVAAAPGMAKAAGVEALAEADPNMLRYGISTEQRKRNLEEFQKSAPGADRTVDLSTEEGRANFALFGGRRVGMTLQQREQIELGMGDVDPAVARNAILRAQASHGGQMADEADRIQTDRKIAEAARKDRLLRVGAGIATSEERTQAAIDSSPELKKSLDALNETLKAQKQDLRNGGLETGFSDVFNKFTAAIGRTRVTSAIAGVQIQNQATREAAISETEERIQTLRNQVGQASEADRIQTNRKIAEAARQDRLLRVGAGIATSEERTQAAIDSSPELKKSLDALNETLKAQKQDLRNGGLMVTSAIAGVQIQNQATREAAIRETEERIQTLRNQVGQASY